MNEARLPLPGSYEDLYYRARQALAAGNIEEAVATYRRLATRLLSIPARVVSRRPMLDDLHRATRQELAALLRSQGRYTEAIDTLEPLLQTHPDNAATLRRDLAILRLGRGDVDTGLAELRALADEAPDQAPPWLILGREARIEGRFGPAHEALDRALDLCRAAACPELAQIHLQRFLLFKDTGQLNDALAAWEEAVGHDQEIGKGVAEVYTMLANAGRYSEALRYVDREPNALRATFQRGLVASMMGNWIEAGQAWRRVADMDPDEFEDGHESWVEAVLRAGDPDPALGWLQEKLREHYNPRLLTLAGMGWAMKRDAEVAANLFQQAINLVRHQRPPKKKLEGSDWRLLESLVADEEIKKGLKTYFAVVETLWR